MVAPFAIANQNCSVEQDQLPEMERLANHSISDAFFDEILSFVREKSQDELRQKRKSTIIYIVLNKLTLLTSPTNQFRMYGVINE